MQQLFSCILLLWLQLLFYFVIDVNRLTPVPFPMGVLLCSSLCSTAFVFRHNFLCNLMYSVFICILLHTLSLIHSVFYLLKKELCSENVLELSYKIVTGFKQHLNEIIKSMLCPISACGHFHMHSYFHIAETVFQKLSTVHRTSTGYWSKITV